MYFCFTDLSATLRKMNPARRGSNGWRKSITTNYSKNTRFVSSNITRRARWGRVVIWQLRIRRVLFARLIILHYVPLRSRCVGERRKRSSLEKVGTYPFHTTILHNNLFSTFCLFHYPQGQFACASTRCEETTSLRSWEVNFAYTEAGERRNALVKVRLCPRCSDRLNYRTQRELTKSEKEKKKEEERRRRKRRENRNEEGSENEDKEGEGEEERKRKREKKRRREGKVLFLFALIFLFAIPPSFA